jgi:hypothetical protein
MPRHSAASAQASGRPTSSKHADAGAHGQRRVGGYAGPRSDLGGGGRERDLEGACSPHGSTHRYQQRQRLRRRHPVQDAWRIDFKPTRSCKESSRANSDPCLLDENAIPTDSCSNL